MDIEDAELICQGENDPQVREALFLALPINIDAARDRIQKQLADPASIIFTICLIENDLPIGQTALFRVDYISRSAIFYLAILSPEHWASGVGTETTALMVDYAFATLNLNRIQLHVNSENHPAIKIYQRIGFQKEGVLRQAMYKNGDYFDFWVMGILHKDWRRLKDPS